jgi:hypothetical protein
MDFGTPDHPADEGAGGRVVPLLSARAARGDGDLFAIVNHYWETQRRGRLAPARTDIDPRGIAAALPYVLLAERVAPGIARLRIAGSELNDLLGMEARGMPLTVFAEPEARALLSGAIETVCNQPAVAEMRLTGPGSYGRPALSGRLMLWPLTSETGRMDRVLGCLVPVGETGRAPRRFQFGPPRLRPLAAPAQSDAPGLSVPALAVPGMAEPPAPAPLPPMSKPPALRTRGHLRLVKSDD